MVWFYSLDKCYKVISCEMCVYGQSKRRLDIPKLECSKSAYYINSHNSAI